MKKGMKWLAVACVLMFASGAMAAEEIIADFDGVGWGGYVADADRANREFDTTDFAPARGSATSVKITFDGGGFVGIQGDWTNIPRNVANYSEFRFWGKSDTDGGSIRFNFIQQWGQTSSYVDVPLTTEWVEYKIPVVDFTGNLNWGDWRIYQFQFFADDGYVVWIDELYMWKSDEPQPPIVLDKSPTNRTDWLDTVEVTFDTEVSGLVAGDLTVDGSAATNVETSDNISFTFTGFVPATSNNHDTEDTITIELAAGNIVNAADANQAFAGYSWDVNLYKPNDAVAAFATTPPTIDGVIGAGEWPGAMYNDFEGNPEQTADYSATWSAAHDDTYVYILLDITDDVLTENPTGQPWESDNEEIYFDWNRDRSTGTQNRLNFDTDNWTVSAGAIADWAVGETADGYVIEMAFEKGEGAGDYIGFNLSLGDDDDSTGGRDSEWWWNVSPSNSGPWNDPSSWGTLALASGTLSGGGIVSNISPNFITVGDTVTLTTGSGSGYQWYQGYNPIPGATEQSLTLDNIAADEAGLYRVTYNDGTEDVEYGITLGVLPAGSVPVAGLFGLGALAALLGAAGVRSTRRK